MVINFHITFLDFLPERREERKWGLRRPGLSFSFSILELGRLKRERKGKGVIAFFKGWIRANLQKEGGGKKKGSPFAQSLKNGKKKRGKGIKVSSSLLSPFEEPLRVKR